MGLKKSKILVVDPDKPVAESLVMVLEVGGFHAVAAHSAEEALTLAAQSIFDVLLTDVVMEDIDGIQIAIAVRSLQPHIRVILFSGSDSASPILHEAMQAGHSFPILAKPLHPAELLSHLQDGAEPPLIHSGPIPSPLPKP